MVVLVEKDGYRDAEVPIARTRSGAVWTNVVGVSAGAALTVMASFFCAFGDCEGKQYLPLGVGAAATGGGLALDLSTNRTLVLARDELVLRLEPVRLAEAPKGALR